MRELSVSSLATADGAYRAMCFIGVIGSGMGEYKHIPASKYHTQRFSYFRLVGMVTARAGGRCHQRTSASHGSDFYDIPNMPLWFASHLGRSLTPSGTLAIGILSASAPVLSRTNGCDGSEKVVKESRFEATKKYGGPSFCPKMAADSSAIHQRSRDTVQSSLLRLVHRTPF